MYLFIFEDGSLGTVENLEPNDLIASDDGVLSIVDMEIRKEYFNGGWVDIRIWDNTNNGN